MESKRVALVSCRSPFLDGDRIYPPLGIMYLDSAIRTASPSSHVDLIDDFDQIQSRDAVSYDAIGISIMTPQRADAERIKRLARLFNPRVRTIGGGPHVKHYTNDMQHEGGWDVLVPNDGERAVLQAIFEDHPPHLINDYIGKSAGFSLIQPPDRLRHANFLANYNYSLQGKKSTTMLTARGCPEQCTFCEDSETTVRRTPQATVERELDEMVELGYKGVYIFDDIFAMSPSFVKPIGEALQARGLIYRANGQARYFTKQGDNLAKLMADTGCVEMAFGFESGSQKILDLAQKRTTIKQNYQSVEYAQRHGINVKGFVMLGLPGETWETMQETEAFIRDAGMNDFQLAVYFPYRGTKIRESIEREESIDMILTGDGLGAYGQKGGKTETVVRTDALRPCDIELFRDYLVDKYKPKAHKPHWEKTE